MGARSKQQDFFSLLPAPRSKPFRELGFYGQLSRQPSCRATGRYNRYKTHPAMIPLISEDMLATIVETVCYFCTAVGVLLTFIFSPRR